MNLKRLTEYSTALVQEFCKGDHPITCAFSGAEDIVVLDLIQRTTRLIPVFAVDTARLMEVYEHAHPRAQRGG